MKLDNGYFGKIIKTNGEWYLIKITGHPGRVCCEAEMRFRDGWYHRVNLVSM